MTLDHTPVRVSESFYRTYSQDMTILNLSGVTVENADLKGLNIFGYDVENWIREQLRREGCQLD